jgi:TolB-like protein/DNA-binding winged helix-turn-helix (wHTH) protein
MAVSAQVLYRFNGFHLDPVRRLLFGADGQPIPLKPRVFATLLYLVERRGELVTKEALLAAVWAHVVVEENNLNKAISTLRQVFGETPNEHRFIVTEPGRGYRFVASVEAVPSVAIQPPPDNAEAGDVAPALGATSKSERPSLMWTALATAAACALVAITIYWPDSERKDSTASAEAAPLPNSVALLPLVNLSPDSDDAYFAVGIHEELLNQLTKIRDLRVASRTSVQSYAATQKSTPEIARELNVESVLDGSVRYAEGRVVVTTRLSDGVTNTTLWSESYEREFSNIFAIQSDIALNVARALRAELRPAEREHVTRVPTTSLRAYELYLSATARGTRETVDETLLAIIEIDEAIALDPGFALAWLQKSELRLIAQYFDPAHAAEHWALGEQAARRTLELDSSLGAAHASLGTALASQRQWTAAEGAYRNALNMNVPLSDPNAYGLMQMYVGNFPYAREIFQAARGVTPQAPTALRFLILANALLGDWPTAVAQHELGTRLFAPWRGADDQMMHLRIGRNELEEARKIPATDPINATMIANLGSPETALRELHRLYAGTGIGDPNGRRNIGIWAGYFGDPTLALDAMRSAINEQGGQAVYLWLPQLSEMRQLPPFKAFLRDIGMVAYWQKYDWPAICRPVGNDDFDCA